MTRADLAWALLGCALFTGGCECGGEPAPPPSVIIEGIVRLAPGAEAPAWPQNPMELPPPRPALPAHCTRPSEADGRPVQPTDDRGLPGVVVMLGDFEESPPHSPRTHELHIRDCRLEPRIVVATRGDTLRIHNDTREYSFMPDLGTGFMQALLSGQSREVVLGQAGVETLQCGFLAPCGRAEVIVLYHPLHAVTDARGRFRIEGVPAGEEVRIAAWHPLFREDGETITMRAGERRTIDFELTPARLNVPRAPAEPPRDGPAENHPDILF